MSKEKANKLTERLSKLPEDKLDAIIRYLDLIEDERDWEANKEVIFRKIVAENDDVLRKLSL